MASTTRPPTPKPPRDVAAPADAASQARLFASIIANAKDAVLVTEAEPVDLASGGPRILFVNEAFTAMTGFTSEDAVGQTPRMLQSPRTDQRELDRLRRALRRWEPVQVELLNVAKDGSEFWVQFIIVPVTDADGWYTHWVSIQRDVTARRQRDEELGAMVRGSKDVVTVVDLDGRIRAASPAAEETLGDALVGSCLFDFLDDQLREILRAQLAVATRPGTRAEPRELRLETRTGRRWFELTLEIASAEEDGASVVVTAVDVTVRRRDRAALRIAEQRFHGAFADAPIGMAVHGEDGALLMANAQLCRLMGRDEEVMLSLGIDDLVHPDDQAASRSERAEVFAGTLDVGRRETRLLHADGRVVGVMMSSSIVRRDGAVVELVIHVEDISERKALEARLTHQALHDALTRLPNRVLFLDRLESALQRADRSRIPVSVLFIDLDRFKEINDTYGHGAGDAVLKTAARRLAALVRPGDTAARFGGDEFTILCEATTAEAAVLIAKRVAQAMEAPIELPRNLEVNLRASIGVATGIAPAATADSLLRDADMAMYAAKEGADVRYEVFDEQLRGRTVARLNHEQELCRAIARDELELHHQPLVGVASGGQPVEFEALVRWQHPERGLLSPGAFIPLAEESGLIVDVDRWVLRQTCADAARLSSGEVKAWVNISLRTLGGDDFIEFVQATLRESGLVPANLGLEITERTVVEAGASANVVIERLRALGIEFAADDFGTGYSSLSALIERPVDVLKIDRSFIDDLPDASSVAVVRAIVAMSGALGLRTVAEGIETAKQFAAASELGCDRAQGFLLARPMPIAALIEHYAPLATR